MFHLFQIQIIKIVLRKAKNVRFQILISVVPTLKHAIAAKALLDAHTDAICLYAMDKECL